MKESHSRSLAKAVSWRITGTLDTFFISWLITGVAFGQFSSQSWNSRYFN